MRTLVIVRDLGDRKLVQAMRGDEAGAVEEFFERFAPLLRVEASLLRIQPAWREEAVVECLEDVAEFLLREGATKPEPLAGYLVASLRQRHLDRRRAEGHRDESRVREGGRNYLRLEESRAVSARLAQSPREVAVTAADAVTFAARLRTRLGRRNP